MPTYIPPARSLRYNGKQFVVKRSIPIASLILLASCLILPANARSYPIEKVQPRYASKADYHKNAARYIKRHNSSLSESDASTFAGYLVSAADKFKIQLSVLLALVKVESGFKPEATSPAGARGLTQVIPKYHNDKIQEARTFFNTYSIYEPKLNIYVGAWALRDMVDRSGDLETGLLMYNGTATDESKAYAKLVLTEADRALAFLQRGE